MPYVLAAYDISDDARRARAAARLLAMGFTRLQRSLYLARGGRTLAKEAYRALHRIVDHATDKVLVMVVPAESLEASLQLAPRPGEGGSRGLVLV
jgi:CRISPR-associated protein Cas2